MDAHIKFVGNGQVVAKLSQVKNIVKSWIFNGFWWILSIIAWISLYFCVQIREKSETFFFWLSLFIKNYLWKTAGYADRNRILLYEKNTQKIWKIHFAILDYDFWPNHTPKTSPKQVKSQLETLVFLLISGIRPKTIAQNRGMNFSYFLRIFLV